MYHDENSNSVILRSWVYMYVGSGDETRRPWHVLSAHGYNWPGIRTGKDRQIKCSRHNMHCYAALDEM